MPLPFGFAVIIDNRAYAGTEEDLAKIPVEQMYELYCLMGRAFCQAMKPTAEEIKDINTEVIDIGIEDLLCEPERPLDGGDVGLLASLVYEHRDAVKAEEAEHANN